jgi:hypothetical protein
MYNPKKSKTEIVDCLIVAKAVGSECYTKNKELEFKMSRIRALRPHPHVSRQN